MRANSIVEGKDRKKDEETEVRCKETRGGYGKRRAKG
jgi:hypothetical protein